MIQSALSSSAGRYGLPLLYPVSAAHKLIYHWAWLIKKGFVSGVSIFSATFNLEFPTHIYYTMCRRRQ
ncbi:hypothetical protein EDD18DRAFT_1186724 [Armillaria luteobubalina]|uniref:Uncharacterized protein n=1 Tax=Armillaria luteobubalina TaxID=153913 RepID=A0AA39PT55_9AGAR|nr:hypothetical protein EDD18DRAFT_1186724 [Armillaria luteobubalina]